MRGTGRGLVAGAVVAAALLAAVAAWWLRSPSAQSVASRDATTALDASNRVGASGAAADDDELAGLPPANVVPLPEGAGADELPDEHNAWAAVDLDAVRAALPDNVYWRMSAPTTDPEVQRARDEERARWNEAYGKVLSNTASEEEILAYYQHRDRLASDYIQFATYLLENYGEQLSIRDIGLLKVAVELNLARLEEIPRQIEEANARRKAHDAAREAWLEDQSDFAPRDGAAR